MLDRKQSLKHYPLDDLGNSKAYIADQLSALKCYSAKVLTVRGGGAASPTSRVIYSKKQSVFVKIVSTEHTDADHIKHEIDKNGLSLVLSRKLLQNKLTLFLNKKHGGSNLLKFTFLLSNQ